MARTKGSKAKATATATSVSDTKKKPGNQGNFHGPPLDFLQSRLEDYFQAGGKKRIFWEKLFPAFFERFDLQKFFIRPLPEDLDTFFDKLDPDATGPSKPTKPADSVSRPSSRAPSREPEQGKESDTLTQQEPHQPITEQAEQQTNNQPEKATAAPGDDEDGEGEASAGLEQPEDSDSNRPDPHLHSSDDEKLKVLIARVKGWYSYRKTVQSRQANPFDDYPHQLKDRGPAPKRLPIHKYYMQQDAYKENCAKVVRERWNKDDDGDALLAFRCEIASELFSQEPPEVQDGLKKRQLEEHAAARAKWEALGEIASVTDPAMLELCRNNVVKAAQPFLDWLRAQTNFHFTLMGGCGPEQPGGKFSMISVHSGKTRGPNPQDITEFNPEAYRAMMGGFVGYLCETVPPEFLKKGEPLSTDHISIPAPSSTPADSATANSAKSVAASAKPAKPVTRQRKKTRNEATPEETPEPPSPPPTPGASETSPPPPSHPPPHPRERSTTPTLRNGLVMGADLADEVAKLPTAKRRARMAQIAKMGEFELDRANNIIRNAKALAQLGLQHGGAAIITQPHLDDQPAGDHEEDDQQEEHDHEPEPDTAAQSTTNDEWPAWVVKAHEVLTDDIDTGVWSELLTQWIALEASYGFETGKKCASLPAAGRPPSVAWWIGRARTKRIPPSVVDDSLEDVAEEFWSWWTSLSPDWRSSENGRLITGGSGSWQSLRYPGQNGILSVLAFLRWWWMKGAEDTVGSEWHAAVADVSWVLGEMLKPSKRPTPKKRLPEDPPSAEDASPAKRQKA